MVLHSDIQTSEAFKSITRQGYAFTSSPRQLGRMNYEFSGLHADERDGKYTIYQNGTIRFQPQYVYGMFAAKDAKPYGTTQVRVHIGKPLTTLADWVAALEHVAAMIPKRRLKMFKKIEQERKSRAEVIARSYPDGEPEIVSQGYNVLTPDEPKGILSFSESLTPANLLADFGPRGLERLPRVIDKKDAELLMLGNSLRITSEVPDQQLNYGTRYSLTVDSNGTSSAIIAHLKSIIMNLEVAENFHGVLPINGSLQNNDNRTVYEMKKK